MEDINYKIYKLIDPISNEVRYIGLTFNSLKQRLYSHLGENSKSHKCNWIKKLKSQGLKPIIEVIEEDISSYDICCEREIYFINFFKENGCNLTNSASGGNKNKKMSEETRKKMSDAKKNSSFKLVLSDETKRIIGENAKKRFENDSEREKLRISNKRYEDSKTEEQKLNDILVQKNSKKVFQYDKDMNFIDEYPSIRNAALKNYIEHTNIAKCCNNKIRMVGGFVWRFEGDIRPPEYKLGHISVIQYDLDNNYITEYKNANVSSKMTGFNIGGILRCCKEKTNSYGGFIWKYKK